MISDICPIFSTRAWYGILSRVTTCNQRCQMMLIHWQIQCLNAGWVPIDSHFSSARAISDFSVAAFSEFPRIGSSNYIFQFVYNELIKLVLSNAVVCCRKQLINIFRFWGHRDPIATFMEISRQQYFRNSNIERSFEQKRQLNIARYNRSNSIIGIHS